MTSPVTDTRQMILRHARNPDGSLVHNLRYSGQRDDRALLDAVPLAFDVDLSALPPEKREQFLAFERAYGNFYVLWRGAGNLDKTISRLMDSVQREVERLRSTLRAVLDSDMGTRSGTPT